MTRRPSLTKILIVVGAGIGIAAQVAWMAIIALRVLFGISVAYVMPTGSMEETLLIGDHILTRPFGGSLESPERGDLIIFQYPVDQRQTFMKRVVGLPGDRIRLANKQLVRNGESVREPYVVHKTSYVDDYRDNFPAGSPPYQLPTDWMVENHTVNGEVVVPPDSFFVLGDNRDQSLDSRYWGFVPTQNVVGRPVMIYWSQDSQMSEEGPVPGDVRWERIFQSVN